MVRLKTVSSRGFVVYKSKIKRFRLTMKQLVKNLGDQFNIPVEELKDLNMDNFVDQAIKVEAGELSSLRVGMQGEG